MTFIMISTLTILGIVCMIMYCKEVKQVKYQVKKSPVDEGVTLLTDRLTRL